MTLRVFVPDEETLIWDKAFIIFDLGGVIIQQLSIAATAIENIWAKGVDRAFDTGKQVGDILLAI